MNDVTTNSGLAPESLKRADELSQTVSRLEKEIRERNRAERILHAIAEGTATVTGTEFFASFVQQLATAYGVKCASVSELVESEKRTLRTMAIWVGDSLIENFEFETENTPCGATLGGKMTLIPRHVTEEYPDLDILDSLQAESYCGLPLYDSTGVLLGNVAIIDDKEMEFDIDQEPALRIFAGRAVAELERIRTEKALRLSEQRLKKVVSAAPIVITSINRDHEIELFEGGALEQIGMTAGQYNGHNCFELWSEEADLTASIRAAFDGKPHDPVMHIVAGTQLETRCSTITDVSGNVSSVIAVCVDMTARQNAENTLRSIALGTSHLTGSDFFGSLVEHVTRALNVCYCVVAEFVDDPPTRARTMAFWRTDCLGSNVEYDLEGTPCADVVSGEPAFHSSDVQNKFPNDTFLVDLNAESYLALPLKDSRNKVIGVLCVLDDEELDSQLQTLQALQIFAFRAAAELERKRSEEAMKQGYTLLHSVIEGTSDAVFVKDRKGRFLTMNSAGATVFGTSSEQVVGKTDAELFDAETSARVVNDDHEIMSTGKTSTYEEAVTCNGRTVTYLTTKGPYRDAHGKVMGVFGVARDISERKQMEKVLRGSEKFHRLLFDKHIDGVAVLRDRHIKYANPVMSEITGYSIDELMGMRPGELMTPADRERSKTNEGSLCFGVPERPLEYTFLRKNGETALVEIRSRRIEIDDQPTVISFIRDITDQKKNKRRLQLTQFAVDKASVAIFWIRQDETFLYVNDAACSSLGYSRAELMAKRLSEIVFGFQEIEFTDGWDLARQEQSLTIESQHRRKDGSVFPVEVTVNCLKFENDEYLCAYVRDISESKIAEKAKRESTALLRTIIEGTTDIVYLQDRCGKYLLINPAGAAAIGLREEEIIGKSNVDLLGAEAAELAKENDSVLQSGRPLVRETNVVINGKQHVFHINTAPHRNAEGKIVGVIGVCRDVTDLKRTEEKSRQLLSDLAHVSRLSTMGEMASGLAHEINQPLAAISNYAHAAAQLVKQEEEPVELEHLQSLLKNIDEQSFRAGEIIRHLRVLVKRSEPVRASVHVRDLLNEVIALTSRELKISSIRLRTKFPAATAEVEADSIQIQQVILNLVRNAIDALLDVPPDQRELEIDLIIKEESIEVRVADSGSGIALGETEDIFKAFFTTKPDGMGMGLAISKSIIESHRGQMWNSLASDGRTTIHFTLPLSRNR